MLLTILIKTLFSFALFTGTIITLSSTNWISAWVGLELNLLSFIPLILHKNDQQTSEAALKYFLTQTFASIFLLFSMMMLMTINYSNIPSLPHNILVTTALALKMGAAPLHFWFPAIMQGMSWLNCFILMTWQKLAPLFIFNAIYSPTTTLFAMTSAIVGAIGGYNQMLIRKILAYSSINHMSWLLVTTMISEKMTMLYFSIYTFLNAVIIFMTNKWNMFHLSQNSGHNNQKNISMLMMTNFLSLGGIPPFLGFLPKWLILSEMILKMPVQMVILTMSSLISLYFYLRITYNFMLKSPSHLSLVTTLPSKMIPILTLISAGSLLIIVPLT